MRACNPSMERFTAFWTGILSRRLEAAGAKGSRVTVIEGQVQVQYANTAQPVGAGEQVSTNSAMPPVGFVDEVRWSRDLNKYVAMLQKFASANQAVASTLEAAGLRYT